MTSDFWNFSTTVYVHMCVCRYWNPWSFVFRGLSNFTGTCRFPPSAPLSPSRTHRTISTHPLFFRQQKIIFSVFSFFFPPRLIRTGGYVRCVCVWVLFFCWFRRKKRGILCGILGELAWFGGLEGTLSCIKGYCLDTVYSRHDVHWD